jgi:hypothetical protein
MVVLLCCRCCQAPIGIFFSFLFWGQGPLVQSRLAALVDTQLRLTHVLPPMRVQTRSIPLALFPPLTGEQSSHTSSLEYLCTPI